MGERTARGGRLARQLVAALAGAGVLAGALLFGPAARADADSCGASGVPTATVYLPNITKTLGGPTGWVTPFIVQNVGASPTRLEISFYRFSDGALVTCRAYPGVLPGTSFADVPNNDEDLPHDSQFAVVVRSFGSQVVSVVNEHQGSGARAEALSYVGLSTGATRVALPSVAKSVGGWVTTFVMQNLGSAPAVVTASFVSADGARTATLVRAMAPGRSAYVDPRAEEELVDGREYAVTLTSTEPIAVVANAHNDAPGVAAPMGYSYNGIATAASPGMYLPYLARNADGIGRTSRIVLQNTGTRDATPTLTIQPFGGGAAISVRAPAAVKPGRTWSFDPRFAADGASACAPAGSASCMGDGEYSAVVSGGAFATLNILASAATAMAYSSQAPAPSRLYLPNVTRTLGGPAGWTTPIVLQSAGATAATVRWYRFADGKLVATEQLSSLAAGAATRIDPRATPGLADGTQYAVVVDARGPVTAIVSELNAQGGDGGMIYEGFASSRPATPVPFTTTVSPDSLTLLADRRQQFIATVRDQFDAVMAGAAVTWTADATGLGTIGRTGLFLSGRTNGTVTVSAVSGTARGTATVTVAVPTSVTVGGLSFLQVATGHADAYLDTAVADADQGTIVAGLDADVTRIEADFERGFATRPSVYVFGTRENAILGNQSILDLSPAQAPEFADKAGFFDTSSSSAVALNWHVAKDYLPITTTRHELTHMLVQQLAGRFTEVPAWLNEGNAVLEEHTVPESGWNTNVDRYQAVSAAGLVPDRLLPLTDLVSQRDWNARDDPEGRFQYSEASWAARFVRDDVGAAGTVRILEALGQGTSFGDAFSTVTGTTFATFAGAFPARLRAAVTSYPGIATSSETPEGVGIHFIAYGFSPSSSVTVAISGPSRRTVTRTTDHYGTFATYLTTSIGWPAGSYRISVTDQLSGRRASATASLVSPASIGSSGPGADAGLLPERAPELGESRLRPRR